MSGIPETRHFNEAIHFLLGLSQFALGLQSFGILNLEKKKKTLCKVRIWLDDFKVFPILRV